MSRRFKSEVKCTVKSVRDVSSQYSQQCQVRGSMAASYFVTLDLYSGGPRLKSSSLFGLCSEVVNTTPPCLVKGP